MPLSRESAEPIVPGAAPLTRREILGLLPGVPGWCLEDGRLRRRFVFTSAGEACTFINEVIALGSERASHYPDICLRKYREVEVSWYTYSSGGLTRTDFVLAAQLGERVRPKGLFR
ncbi:4a-hydroxytetrahydrobiopterin dehydratase [uncultured Methanofollis sp.]|uniref:4a-hydroxytetrahydrobiopterin dehydratase n=1 Tax=uncultured Methanofollis sp. TaxID=262500 RepID=UPI00262BD2E4|nr:4a-hydroxytetrahydrobiopterin dehydratase [uncultured Methanofollis sp.]